MNKIVFLGMNNLMTDEKIEAQKDYGIMLTAQRISEEKLDSDSDEDNAGIKYRIKVSHIDSIIDLGKGKNVKFEKGKSPSQKQKWVIIGEIGDDGYENFMSWLLTRIPELCNEWREQLFNLPSNH
jgi:hypothetical protein